MKYQTNILIINILQIFQVSAATDPTQNPTGLKDKIQYHQLTAHNSPLYENNAHHDLNSQIEKLKHKAESEARARLNISTKGYNQLDNASTDNNTSLLKSRKSTSPYPISTAYQNNSPPSSNSSPWLNLQWEHKDNSPSGSAAAPFEVKIDKIDKRWLVKDATTNFPHTMEMDFKHEDTSPPKVQGETEHAGPTIEIEHKDNSPSGSSNAPYEPKQELPYKVIKKGKGIFTGFSTTTDGQSLEQHDSKNAKQEKKEVSGKKSNNQTETTEKNSAIIDDKKCKEDKVCSSGSKTKEDTETPYDINITHSNNSPKADADKPYTVSKKANDMPEMAIDALESLNDLNAVKDQQQVMRVQYNTARDQLAELKEKLEFNKKDSANKISDLELSNEVAEERKRKLMEDFEALNNKFVMAETTNTNLKTENLKLQNNLKEENNKLFSIQQEDKNKKASFEANENELQQLRANQSKLLHEKVELQTKLENEMGDRKRREAKNGSLKMQLDQEIATNEYLKKKIISGISKEDAKEILKKSMNDKDIIDGLDKDKKADETIKNNNTETKTTETKPETKDSKFQNEEQVEQQTKNSRLKNKKGSSDQKINLTGLENNKDKDNYYSNKKQEKSTNNEVESPQSLLTNNKEEIKNKKENKRDNLNKENKDSIKPADLPQNI